MATEADIQVPVCETRGEQVGNFVDNIINISASKLSLEKHTFQEHPTVEEDNFLRPPSTGEVPSEVNNASSNVSKIADEPNQEDSTGPLLPSNKLDDQPVEAAAKEDISAVEIQQNGEESNNIEKDGDNCTDSSVVISEMKVEDGEKAVAHLSNDTGNVALPQAPFISEGEEKPTEEDWSEDNSNIAAEEVSRGSNMPAETIATVETLKNDELQSQSDLKSTFCKEEETTAENGSKMSESRGDEECQSKKLEEDATAHSIPNIAEKSEEASLVQVQDSQIECDEHLEEESKKLPSAEVAKGYNDDNVPPATHNVKDEDEDIVETELSEIEPSTRCLSVEKDRTTETPAETLLATPKDTENSIQGPSDEQSSNATLHGNTIEAEEATVDAIDGQKESIESCPPVVSSSSNEGSMDSVLQDVTCDRVEALENLSTGEAHTVISNVAPDLTEVAEEPDQIVRDGNDTLLSPKPVEFAAGEEISAEKIQQNAEELDSAEKDCDTSVVPEQSNTESLVVTSEVKARDKLDDLDVDDAMVVTQPSNDTSSNEQEKIEEETNIPSELTESQSPCITEGEEMNVQAEATDNKYEGEKPTEEDKSCDLTSEVPKEEESDQNKTTSDQEVFPSETSGKDNSNSAAEEVSLENSTSTETTVALDTSKSDELQSKCESNSSFSKEEETTVEKGERSVAATEDYGVLLENTLSGNHVEECQTKTSEDAATDQLVEKSEESAPVQISASTIECDLVEESERPGGTSEDFPPITDVVKDKDEDLKEGELSENETGTRHTSVKEDMQIETKAESLLLAPEESESNSSFSKEEETTAEKDERSATASEDYEVPVESTLSGSHGEEELQPKILEDATTDQSNLKLEEKSEESSVVHIEESKLECNKHLEEESERLPLPEVSTGGANDNVPPVTDTVEDKDEDLKEAELPENEPGTRLTSDIKIETHAETLLEAPKNGEVSSLNQEDSIRDPQQEKSTEATLHGNINEVDEATTDQQKESFESSPPIVSSSPEEGSLDAVLQEVTHVDEVEKQPEVFENIDEAHSETSNVARDVSEVTEKPDQTVRDGTDTLLSSEPVEFAAVEEISAEEIKQNAEELDSTEKDCDRSVAPEESHTESLDATSEVKARDKLDDIDVDDATVVTQPSKDTSSNEQEKIVEETNIPREVNEFQPPCITEGQEMDVQAEATDIKYEGGKPTEEDKSCDLTSEVPKKEESDQNKTTSDQEVFPSETSVEDCPNSAAAEVSPENSTSTETTTLETSKSDELQSKCESNSSFPKEEETTVEKGERSVAASEDYGVPIENTLSGQSKTLEDAATDKLVEKSEESSPVQTEASTIECGEHLEEESERLPLTDVSTRGTSEDVPPITDVVKDKDEDLKEAELSENEPGTRHTSVKEDMQIETKAESLPVAPEDSEESSLSQENSIRSPPIGASSAEGAEDRSMNAVEQEVKHLDEVDKHTEVLENPRVGEANSETSNAAPDNSEVTEKPDETARDGTDTLVSTNSAGFSADAEMSAEETQPKSTEKDGDGGVVPEECNTDSLVADSDVKARDAFNVDDAREVTQLDTSSNEQSTNDSLNETALLAEKTVEETNISREETESQALSFTQGEEPNVQVKTEEEEKCDLISEETKEGESDQDKTTSDQEVLTIVEDGVSLENSSSESHGEIECQPKSLEDVGTDQSDLQLVEKPEESSQLECDEHLKAESERLPSTEASSCGANDVVSEAVDEVKDEGNNLKEVELSEGDVQIEHTAGSLHVDLHQEEQSTNDDLQVNTTETEKPAISEVVEHQKESLESFPPTVSSSIQEGSTNAALQEVTGDETSNIIEEVDKRKEVIEYLSTTVSTGDTGGNSIKLDESENQKDYLGQESEKIPLPPSSASEVSGESKILHEAEFEDGESNKAELCNTDKIIESELLKTESRTENTEDSLHVTSEDGRVPELSQEIETSSAIEEQDLSTHAQGILDKLSDGKTADEAEKKEETLVVQNVATESQHEHIEENSVTQVDCLEREDKEILEKDNQNSSLTEATIEETNSRYWESRITEEADVEKHVDSLEVKPECIKQHDSSLDIDNSIKEQLSEADTPEITSDNTEREPVGVADINEESFEAKGVAKSSLDCDNDAANDEESTKYTEDSLIKGEKSVESLQSESKDEESIEALPVESKDIEAPLLGQDTETICLDEQRPVANTGADMDDKKEDIADNTNCLEYETSNNKQNSANNTLSEDKEEKLQLQEDSLQPEQNESLGYDGENAPLTEAPKACTTESSLVKEEHMIKPVEEQIVTAEPQETCDKTHDNTVNAADEKNDAVGDFPTGDQDYPPNEVGGSQNPSSEEAPAEKINDDKPTAVHEANLFEEQKEIESDVAKEEVCIESIPVVDKDIKAISSVQGTEASHLEEQAPTTDSQGTSGDHEDGKTIHLVDAKEDIVEDKNYAIATSEDTNEDSLNQVDGSLVEQKEHLEKENESTSLTYAPKDSITDSILVREVAQVEDLIDPSKVAAEDNKAFVSCQDTDISSAEEQILDVGDISNNKITENITEATSKETQEAQDIAKSVPPKSNWTEKEESTGDSFSDDKKHTEEVLEETVANDKLLVSPSESTGVDHYTTESELTNREDLSTDKTAMGYDENKACEEKISDISSSPPDMIQAKDTDVAELSSNFNNILDTTEGLIVNESTSMECERSTTNLEAKNGDEAPEIKETTSSATQGQADSLTEEESDLVEAGFAPEENKSGYESNNLVLESSAQVDKLVAEDTLEQEETCEKEILEDTISSEKEQVVRSEENDEVIQNQGSCEEEVIRDCPQEDEIKQEQQKISKVTVAFIEEGSQTEKSSDISEEAKDKAPEDREEKISATEAIDRTLDLEEKEKGIEEPTTKIDAAKAQELAIASVKTDTGDSYEKENIILSEGKSVEEENQADTSTKQNEDEDGDKEAYPTKSAEVEVSSTSENVAPKEQVEEVNDKCAVTEDNSTPVEPLVISTSKIIPEGTVGTPLEANVQQTKLLDLPEELNAKDSDNKTSEKDLLEHASGLGRTDVAELEASPLSVKDKHAVLEVDDARNLNHENLSGNRDISTEIEKPSKVWQEEAECENDERTDQEREGRTEPKDTSKSSLSDLFQVSMRERAQLAEKEPTSHNEDMPAENSDDAENEHSKTDEEKDDEDELHEQQKSDSVSEAPVMVDMTDADVKAAQKKSHNILSGVGSKVKHSIAKVKKAITGKSSHPKPPSPKKVAN